MKKIIKRSLLYFLKFTGIYALTRYLTRKGVRILCYHGVWLGDEGFPGDGMFMNAGTFESRLDLILKFGFPVVSLDRAIVGRSLNDLPPSSVVITIDDGWYSTYSSMLPALLRRNMPATLYCDTDHVLSGMPVPHVMARCLKYLADAGYVNSTPTDETLINEIYLDAIDLNISLLERLEKTRELAASLSIDFEYYVAGRVFDYMKPEELAEAYKAGLDIQLHTHTHSMHDFDTDLIVEEIEVNRRQLSKIIGVDPEKLRHFCYPSGVCSKDVEPVFDKTKIISATTTEQSIAFDDDNVFFLPRILDGEHFASIEFEAELCGVMEMLRRVRRLFDPGARQ